MVDTYQHTLWRVSAGRPGADVEMSGKDFFVCVFLGFCRKFYLGLNVGRSVESAWDGDGCDCGGLIVGGTTKIGCSAKVNNSLLDLAYGQTDMRQKVL
jgi:hypothetical protein